MDLQLSKFYRSFLTFVLGIIFSVSAWAQDEGIDVDVDLDGDGPAIWYENPLYWVIGALLLIILVAVITNSGKKS